MSYHFKLSEKKIHIVTIHGKEKVIGPLLEQRLKASTEVIQSLNTDKFGTFSGEVERKDPPVSTLRKKIEAAHDLTGYSMIVGSEGSFGAHPAFFMMPANEEWVMLKDFDRNLEIVGRYLTEETNFSGKSISSLDEFRQFCERVKFPSHGLILKIGNPPAQIHKDLTGDQLEALIRNSLEKDELVTVETDMRADRNPTRLKAIKKATVNLLDRIESTCPACDTPGYWIREVVPGLPCRGCGAATKSIKSYIYKCKYCGETEERPRENKTSEDPMYCDFCNP